MHAPSYWINSEVKSEEKKNDNGRNDKCEEFWSWKKRDFFLLIL